MKKSIIMLMLLIFGNQIKAQSGIDCLYDSLQFTNDVCQKTIDVTYLSFGKNPISPANDKDDNIRKIKEQLKYIPHSSVHFSYKEKEYYISISDECDMSPYSEGDIIKIDITFYKDIKQPYKNEKPFSLITSVTDSPSAQGDSSLFQSSEHRFVLDHPVNLGETFHGWKDGYGYILPPSDQFLRLIRMSYNGIDYELGLTNNDIIRFISTSDKRFSVNGYKVGDEITRTSIIRGWGIIAKIDDEWYAAWMPKDINHPEEEETGKIQWFFKFDFHAPVPDNRTDSVSSRSFRAFDTGHVILAYLMCRPHNSPRLFDPQIPAFWLGSMWTCDGFMGRKADGIPLKEGFLRQNEAGFTLMQLSKGLSHDVFGATTALQLGVGTIGLDRDYEATREDGKIGFVDAEETLSSSTINYLTIRVPVLLGIQDRRHRFSLLSGVALDFCIPGRDRYNYRYHDDDKSRHWRIHANSFSANWQVMAGIGPLTLSYTQGLIPLFKLRDGSGIYTSSLCVGLDLWYLIRK